MIDRDNQYYIEGWKAYMSPMHVRCPYYFGTDQYKHWWYGWDEANDSCSGGIIGNE